MKEFDELSDAVLSPEQIELLSLLLEEEGLGGSQKHDAPQVSAATDAARLPLSYAQQRLWTIDRLQSGSAIYNCPAVVRLRGQLNFAALERAVNEVVKRHDVMRAVFPATNGVPTQVILPALSINIPVTDLRERPEDEREAEARRLAAEEAWRPFNLENRPLLRLSLFRLNDEDHVLVFVAHHIIVDAWSMGIFLTELGSLYGAFSQGQPSPLPPLRAQYADFARWQLERLRGPVLEEQLSYWKRQLGGNFPVIEVPHARPRPSAPSNMGARQVFVIRPALADALNALSQREGVTLFMTLLAAFQTLLHRYTGREDVVVGTAIGNRNREGTENLIGCFINTLLLRTDLSGSPRFIDVLRQVREVTLGAFSNQELPFEKLVEELQPERSLAQTAMFQIAFGVQNVPMPPLALPGLTLERMELEKEMVRLDLTVWIEETADGLRVAWTYSTDTLDAAAISRMQRHYETLLTSIVADASARLDALEMLTEEEKQQAASEEKVREESKRARLLKVKPKAMQVRREQ